MAFGFEPLVVELNDVMIFRMYDPDPVTGCVALHSQLDAAEVHLHRETPRMRRQKIRGEHLEAGKALLDGFWYLVEGFERQLSGERDVKGVIDVRFVPPTIDA